MSTTVAVTLITAVSTLTGGAISGFVAILVSRSQSKAQIEIARTQQLDQRSTARRQIQRDAYLQFLSQVAKAEETFNNIWNSKSGLNDKDTMKPLWGAMIDIYQSKDLVGLEGPLDVAAIAAELSTQFTMEINNIRRISGGAWSEGIKEIMKGEEDNFTESHAKRTYLKSQFIKAAQAHLNG